MLITLTPPRSFFRWFVNCPVVRACDSFQPLYVAFDCYFLHVRLFFFFFYHLCMLDCIFSFHLYSFCFGFYLVKRRVGIPSVASSTHLRLTE